MSKTNIFARWILLFIMALALLTPAAAFAQEGDGPSSEETNSTETTDDHGEATTTETTDDHGETTNDNNEVMTTEANSDNIAIGITLFIIGFILLVIISVVLITTAGMGVIGIGVALSSSDD